MPQSLVERCARHVAALDVFYPKCNPNILSDAKVGIHLLAGAARAAFATVLVGVEIKFRGFSHTAGS